MCSYLLEKIAFIFYIRNTVKGTVGFFECDREPRLGGNSVLVKNNPNITPEWQFQQPFGLVDADVAYVTGKYNVSYTLREHFYANSGGTANSFVL